VLHDVVEDTTTPLSEIRERLGDRVAELVHAVTLDPLEGFGGDKPARDRVYYARFAESPAGAHTIKLHDRIDNVNDMATWPTEGQLGYLARTRETVIAALRPRSPSMAAAVEAEVARLEARVRRHSAKGLADALEPHR
jgi:(p)ppGpp synthase/HD superfamily hydrolase